MRTEELTKCFEPLLQNALITEAVLMCTHNLCFEQKYEKYIKKKKKSSKIIILQPLKISAYCMGLFA